jgi:hypothetical protein
MDVPTAARMLGIRVALFRRQSVWNLFLHIGQTPDRALSLIEVGKGFANPVRQATG